MACFLNPRLLPPKRVMPIRPASAFAAVAFATAVSLASAAYAVQQAGFVGVVGNWSNVQDGGAAFKVDTAGWSGTTERSALEAQSTSLFGSVDTAFVSNGSARQAFPLAVFPEVKDFTGGTIKVQFKMLGGATDQNGGIVFSLKPNGEYLFVRYNTAEGNIAVWSYKNGRRAAVGRGTVNVQLPLNAWHELALTITGTQLKATVNDNALTYDFTLPEPVAGRVGLWTKRDAITVFKNYRVTKTGS